MAIDPAEREKIAENLRRIVATVAELSEDAVGLDAKFVEELDLDSMALLEIAAAVEREYKIRIDEQDLKKLATINDAVDLASKYLAAS
jgi:acyl carrier protein